MWVAKSKNCTHVKNKNKNFKKCNVHNEIFLCNVHHVRIFFERKQLLFAHTNGPNISVCVCVHTH